MSKFQGIIVPMVTPFNRDDAQTINYEAGEKLVEKLIAGGASGIFTFGSNGEFHVCTPDEKIEFSKFVIEKVAGRVPVYVGTGACSTREACEMSKRAEAIGADALSVINPYFLGISDAQVATYFRMVAESVKIPVMLYNIPKATGKNISPEVVAEVAQIDNVKGVKDSSGNMDNLKAYIEPIRDVLHLGSTPQTLKRSLELAGYEVGPARFPVTEVAEGVDEKAVAMLDHYGIAHR